MQHVSNLREKEIKRAKDAVRMKKGKEKNAIILAEHARKNVLRRSGRQAIDVTDPVRFAIDEIICDELIEEQW